MLEQNKKDPLYKIYFMYLFIAEALLKKNEKVLNFSQNPIWNQNTLNTQWLYPDISNFIF